MSSGSVSQPKTNGSGKIIPADLEALPQLEAGTAKDIEPAQKDAPPPRVPYRALFRQVFQNGAIFTPLYADKWDILAMIAGTLGSLVNGASMPIFAIILGDIMNDFGLYQDDFSGLTSKIRDTVPYFVYLGVVAFVGAYCQGFFWTTASVRQVNRMRGVYLHRVLHQEIGYFDTVATSGFLLQGLNEDCITIQTAIGDKVAMFLFFSSTFICGTVIALVRGWDMALVIMSLLPVLGGAGFAVMLLVARMTSIINRAYAGANSLAQQALSNVRTVYAFNGEERTVTDYGNSLDEPMKVGIKQGFIAGSTLGLVNCVAFCTYALAMWYGAKRVEDGVYDGGKVLTVLFASLIGGFALGQAAPNIQYFQQGQVSAARLFEILDRKSQIDADGPGKTLKSVEGVVELRDVTFAYPARPDKPVFDGFNLIVPAGQTVALVGESGSGKSTVVQLIERFYDPQAGTVFLDNVDIRTLQLRWLRSQIGLVSQEPTLFATTIRENILFGKPGSTQEEVIEAAKAANAHKFISALPEGYDTHVGEKGVQMSGGQKQRIAIARAILKDPRVLLLDEATSALDAESEHVVQEALDKLMVGRTTVVVAHRLSTVRDANSIAVVYQGRIIEQGTHDGLLKQNGAYATLVQMQQSTDPSSSSPKGSSRRQKTISSTQDTEHHSSDLKEFADQALEVVVESLQSPNKNRNMAVPLMAPQRMTSGWRRYFSLRARNREPQEAIPEQEPYDPKTKPDKASKSKKKGKEEDEGPPVKVGLGRLAKLNKPELPAAAGGLVGSAAMGMLFPIFALAFSSLIAVFYLPPDEISSGAQKWSLVFMGLGFGSLVASWMQSYCFNFMGQRLGRRVRVLMMQALLRQEVGWFDDERNSSGVLTSKLSADALAVKGQFGDTMGLLTQNLVTMVASFIIAGFYSWRMMLVVTSCLPILVISVVIQNLFMLRSGTEEEETFAQANATAAEAFSSARTVAAFGMEDQVAALYRRSLEKPTTEARKRANYAGIGFGSSQLVVFGVYALAFWYMGLEITRGYSSFEDTLIAFMAIFMAAMGIAQAQVYFPDVAKGKAAVQRVFSIIDRKPLIDASDPGGFRPSACEGKVELRDVTFAYPQRPDAPVFTNFNLIAPAGCTVAIVGESGSGKSTVVQLIERFYDPLEGTILLDDVDIRTLNLHWLRSQVGLVSQEPVLFSMTVADNIRYGRPEASLESVIAAAKAANAHTFIEALPEGYNTLLGEGAIQLSGGQKQRVAIARAVVKDPRVLLLDEATSALDAESERVVQEALDKLMVGRTTIVIAHRLSTIKDADSIAVVYKGHLVEQGTHRDLVAADGTYARLVSHQL